jgi:uncharacterized protein (TIGR03435 family)
MTHELLNHLWQSTVFAVAVGLLTLLFRRNGAHTRYWLWFAASCKFLVPFSLLSEIGSRLSWRTTPGAALPPMLGQFAQPFSAASTGAAVPAASAAVGPIHSAGINWALICYGVWACGAIVVAGYWMVRWLRLHADVKNAAPLELDAPIPARSSWAPNEPGVVGLFRPVLLLPDGICDRLTRKQLQTIVAHEMCHVRRRDNLTAAIHMLVEALFWYHPLVWWIGRRMIVEREAACDEAVLATGGEREDYAEALLTVCKFYVESPLASAAGVAGADLKKRIVGIMTPRVTYRLNAAKKILLAAAATATVVAPIAIASFFATPTRAIAQAPETDAGAFQSVSIQQSQPETVAFTIGVGPDTFKVQNYSLRQVIAWAFDTQSALITGPDMLDTKYNIEAKSPAPFPGGGGNDVVNAARAMVRNMLANQFQLQIHRGTQSISDAYVLKSGGANVLLKVARPGEAGPLMGQGFTSISGTNLPMHDFVELLSQRLGHAVVDQTGLTQTYDFNVDWGAGGAPPAAANAVVRMSNPAPDVLANALQSQAGLTLQPSPGPVEVLVVDHVTLPKSVVPARTAVPMDPTAFDAYAGHYLFMGTAVVNVYRDGGHFFSQPPGQPPIEIFPDAQGDFFAKVVDAQVSFEKDAAGRVTGLVLHQGGQNISMPRVDEATAKQMTDAMNAKMQQKTATPGSEEALREDLAELTAGKPDYSRMSPELAEVTKEELSALQREFVSLGSMTSLKFTGVDPHGSDIYEAGFEHGNVECHIAMMPDGKIASVFLQPLP